jgi:hypothetical protein
MNTLAHPTRKSHIKQKPRPSRKNSGTFHPTYAELFIESLISAHRPPVSSLNIDSSLTLVQE